MSNREQMISELKRPLEYIIAVEPSELVRAEELGGANFERAVPLVELMVELFQDIKANLDSFSLSILQKVHNRATNTQQAVVRVRAFRLQGHGDPTSRRDQLINSLESEYDELMSEIGPHINYLLRKQTDFGTIEATAHEMVQRLEELTSDTLVKQTEAVEKTEAILQTARVAAGKVGVGQQSDEFSKQAKQHGNAAKRWLIAASILGVISLIAVLASFFGWSPTPKTTSEFVRELAGRFVILTLLAYALGFAVRQYTSSKHNETVNQHRQSALQTFETFVSAADDQETKDAVLLEATRSIFAAQPSGFLRGGHETESPSTIIEVIRRISSASSSKS